jgi:hypothetical protein
MYHALKFTTSLRLRPRSKRKVFTEIKSQQPQLHKKTKKKQTNKQATKTNPSNTKKTADFSTCNHLALPTTNRRPGAPLTPRCTHQHHRKCPENKKKRRRPIQYQLSLTHSPHRTIAA